MQRLKKSLHKLLFQNIMKNKALNILLLNLYKNARFFSEYFQKIFRLEINMILELTIKLNWFCFF